MASCLRKDLVATTGDDQGVACVEVTDPSSGTSFRFYDFEYALAQQLTGQPLEAVAVWASATYGIDLAPETLNAFIEKLAGLGFLTDPLLGSGAQPEILSPYAPSPGSFSSGPWSAKALGPAAAAAGHATTLPAADQMLGGSEDGAVDDAIALLGSQEHVIAGPALEGALQSDPPADFTSGPEVTASAASVPFAGKLRDPQELLPRLEVLASPLPPVVSEGSKPNAEPTFSPVTPPGRPGPGVQSPAGLPVAAAVAAPVAPQRPTSGAGSAVTAETPLDSIARAIAESTAPPPPGAIDIGAAATALRPGDGPANAKLSGAAAMVGPVARDKGTGKGISLDAPMTGTASANGSWAADLDRAVAGGNEPQGGRDDRRQPPRPEVVVMPPMAEPAAAAPRRGRLAFLAVVVLGGGLAAAVWFMRPTEGPPAPPSSSEVAPRVHAVSPQPTTFYGWFETVGVVVPGQDQMLAFRIGGRVQEVMPPGTTFVAGEAIARLQGSVERELIVNRLRSRIAYFEQLRASSRSESTEAAARLAEAKLSARKQELATAQAALEDLVIRPKIAGVIAEAMATKGGLIKAGTVVLRVRSTAPRATFGFSADDASRARALGFCRLETIPVAGAGPVPDTGVGGAKGSSGSADAGTADDKTRAVDCALPSPPTAEQAVESRVSVDFVGAPTLAIGTQVRLASARYDGVFPVPRAAVVRDGDADRVWIVSGGGRFAERRTVELAATVDALGLVAHGIAVGDSVVIDAPATLKAGGEINVVR